MSRYPGATWRPLTENYAQHKIKPTQLIFHSAVSKGDSLFGYFEQKKVIVESHFYVQDDGDVEQYMDTHVQADANYKANPRAVSVETWDNGDPDHIPWNSAQLYRLAEIAAWEHLEDGIPLVRCPGPNEPGIGGHTDYKEWSNVRGKTCPGLARRSQINTVIAMAKVMVAGKIPTPPTPKIGELVMDAATTAQMRKVFQEELHSILGNANSDTDKDETHYSLADIQRDFNGLKAEVKELKEAFLSFNNAPMPDLTDPVPPTPA